MAVQPPAPPVTVPPDKWEDEFWKKHNITDDKEKDIIRGRARVLAYDRARRRAEESEDAPPKDKKWYDD
jgi:hypothetical protein